MKNCRDDFVYSTKLCLLSPQHEIPRLLPCRIIVQNKIRQNITKASEIFLYKRLLNKWTSKHGKCIWCHIYCVQGTNVHVRLFLAQSQTVTYYLHVVIKSKLKYKTTNFIITIYMYSIMTLIKIYHGVCVATVGEVYSSLAPIHKLVFPRVSVLSWK